MCIGKYIFSHFPTHFFTLLYFLKRIAVTKVLNEEETLPLQNWDSVGNFYFPTLIYWQSLLEIILQHQSQNEIFTD